MTTLWERLSQLHPPTPDQQTIAQHLLDDYLQKGYLAKTCPEMLALDDATIIAFYHGLAQTRSADSPVRHLPNSGWMADADFCFINIRATGTGNQHGNFLTTARLLPIIRANAIHLGPFTDYDHHVIYAVRSVRTIDQRLTHPTLGLSPDDQMRALVQATHLLGKVIGFDLEPHMTQFAKPVLMHPELFRWVRVPDGKPDAPLPQPMTAVLQEGYQAQLVAEVREIVEAEMEEAGLRDLESSPSDDHKTRGYTQQVYYRIIRAVIDAGYWTIPSQSWAAHGLPDYRGYYQDKNYPKWDYRSPSGEDLYHMAFHALTPIKFYTGLIPNRATADAREYEPGIAYFCDIFSYWRDEFDFDFVRQDSADHIFDSLYNDDFTKPASDRPTPAILARLNATTCPPVKPYIGNMAERMGDELEDYAGIGYDVLLGSDMFYKMDRGLIEKCFHLADRHIALNQNRPTRTAITFAVDTHDTGNKGLLGASIIEIAGFAGMRQRHFVSRFFGAGLARRPKYEVIGAQDLSHGLFPANIRDINLTWVGDANYARHYHILEDIYDACRQWLDSGTMVYRHADDRLAWWAIQADGRWLVAAISLEHADQEAIHPFVMDLTDVRSGPLQGVVYDFSDTHGRPFFSDWAGINMGWLPYQAFRLWVLEK